MIQKILRVGTSAAVTLPKKSLEELGLSIGDSINVTTNKKMRRVMIEPVASVDAELIEWTDTFIERYRPALEALAKK